MARQPQVSRTKVFYITAAEFRVKDGSAGRLSFMQERLRPLNLVADARHHIKRQ